MVFNRPGPTAQVFAEIARQQPRTLLVIADGPRTNHPEDAECCARARAIIDQVDWDCVVHRNYADTNLGLRLRISSGLNWAFGSVEEAIVLEDDCLPHPTFFRFCEELLERYRNNPRVMHISGDNFQFGRHQITTSYYFSRYPHIWGWASWRRAWAHYDVELMAWTETADRNRYLRSLDDSSERSFWGKCWDDVSQGVINTWDYQWAFACLAQEGLCVMPAQNLVSNIGFGGPATNTVSQQGLFDRMVTFPMRFPLSHPTRIERDARADSHTARLFFCGGGHIPRRSLALNIVRRLLEPFRGLRAC